MTATTRFTLPMRIRSRQRPATEMKVRLDLIDRIAALQGIRVSERDDQAGPCRVDVHLGTRARLRPLTGGESSLLCSLSREGMTVYGLDRWARYQVLARGWGGLNKASVLVYLPRDSKELEAVWKIVKRAYDIRKSQSEGEVGTQVISTWDWPEFSRTSLQ